MWTDAGTVGILGAPRVAEGPPTGGIRLTNEASEAAHGRNETFVQAGGGSMGQS